MRPSQPSSFLLALSLFLVSEAVPAERFYIVTTDTNLKEKRRRLVQFLRGWNRALNFYATHPELMVPYIQKKLGVKEVPLARRMIPEKRL